MINDLTEDFNIEAQSPDWMIPYYDSQMSGVRQELTELIRLLLRQTFVLERKYDKKAAVSSIRRSTEAAAAIWNSSAIIFLWRGSR